jgi:hypothetical protein
MTGIFGILESSAAQWYQDVARNQEFFFFIVTSIVYAFSSWQLQIKAKTLHFRFSSMTKRFIFWWWRSGFLVIRSQDSPNGTISPPSSPIFYLLFFYLHFFAVYVSIVYGLSCADSVTYVVCTEQALLHSRQQGVLSYRELLKCDEAPAVSSYRRRRGRQACLPGRPNLERPKMKVDCQFHPRRQSGRIEAAMIVACCVHILVHRVYSCTSKSSWFSRVPSSVFGLHQFE